MPKIIQNSPCPQRNEEQLAVWRRGVILADGYRTVPADVHVDSPFGKGAWLRVILRDSRKRKIHETGSHLGLQDISINTIGKRLAGNSFWQSLPQYDA